MRIFVTTFRICSPAQFDTYLANFPRFKATGCEGPITELKIWETPKLVDQDKILGVDGLHTVHEAVARFCSFAGTYLDDAGVHNSTLHQWCDQDATQVNER